MAKYDVYGIGNALVDMEYEVDVDFLSKLNIEKGLMTLVDENRQAEILNNLGSGKHKRSCGGSAANTIIAVAQMGGNSFYSCKVASDETGDFYYKDLVGHGVKTNLTDERESGITGKCLVLITPDADRTMNSFLGITATFSKNELVESEIKDSKYLYIEGYLVTGPDAKAAAIEAKKIAKDAGVKTSLTFSDPGIVAHFKDGFNEIIGDDGVDLLFCNEEEAFSFTGTDNIESAAAELKKVAKAFAVTQGPRGAYIWDGEKEIDILTESVDAIDTNGAGDLFAGSFLYAITNGYSYGQAGKLACAASSKLVTQFGARLENDQAKEVKTKVLG